MIFGCCAGIDNYEETAAAGFSYIELPGWAVAAMSESEFERARDKILGGPIPCWGFNSYCRGRPAIVGPDFSEREAVDYARLLCRRGRELGIRSIGIGAPAARRLPEGYDRELADRQCERFLTLTCAAAAEQGISILFEAVHDRMCNYANFSRDAVGLVERLALPNLFMVLDFYHMRVMGEDVLDISAALPHIRHTHISTCGPELERDFPQAEELPYYADILRALRAGGYDGSMSVEADLRLLPAHGAGSVEMLRRAELSLENNRNGERI